jgi:hypothetical protein
MNNINQNNNLHDISLNGGVLIIGSLLWDPQREDWRNKYLKIEDKINVPAPVRYGRVSQTRNCTFTMLFSNECNHSKEKMGKAFFVPFKENPINFSQLKIQTTELIKAERNKSNIEDRLYWDWGALAIAVNPKNSKVDKLLQSWSKCYGNGFNPDKYKVGTETPVLDKNGILSFTWTNELENYDFLIATATKPNVERYPTAENVADRIIVNEYSEYFDKNTALGITTFQDNEITEIIHSKYRKI